MEENERKVHWRIGEIMIQKDWITWPQLEEALQTQEIHGGMIGEILVELGHASPQYVFRALAYQYGMEYVEFKDVEIEERAIRAVPKECAYSYKIMPLQIAGDTLRVAVSSPCCEHVKVILQQITGLASIECVIACPESIDIVMTWYYRLYRSVA